LCRPLVARQFSFIFTSTFLPLPQKKDCREAEEPSHDPDGPKGRTHGLLYALHGSSPVSFPLEAAHELISFQPKEEAKPALAPWLAPSRPALPQAP
jgi:hypothetical protein